MTFSAALFLCASAVAIDGDTIKCEAPIGNVRLAAIDAPEMPGHCRRGRDCAPGDPVMVRDTLTYLLGQLDGKAVWCLTVDAQPDRKGFQPRDHWGRLVARCSVDGKDLSETLLSFKMVRPWP